MNIQMTIPQFFFREIFFVVEKIASQRSNFGFPKISSRDKNQVLSHSIERNVKAEDVTFACQRGLSEGAFSGTLPGAPQGVVET